MNTPLSKEAGDSASIAQIAEMMMHRTAIGVFLVTMAYVLSAVVYLVDAQVARYMEYLQLVLGIAAIAVVLPVFVKYSRIKARRQAGCPESDSFMAEMFQRAGIKAFSFTFVFLVVLDVVTKREFVEFPTPFYINLILAFSLGVFSITYFRLVHSSGADEHDDEFAGESGS